MPVYSVTQVTRYLKDSLERDHLLSELWISGEVSNLRTSTSGHTYLTLKDGQAQLRSVMFKGAGGAELLLEGSQVMAHGRVSFYLARGDVQFVADLVMPQGTGPLFLKLEELRMRLEAEGLFEVSRKRPLPRFPRVVGLVTSPSGAVLHDVCNVIARRYPSVEVLVAPTAVQGDEAAQGIVAAIQALNQEGRAGVIVLARGGGSLEELWPFNEEAVARAIYASRVPVVSAVGHETDYTIADSVADVRAPTPSAAAELVVPDAYALAQEVASYREAIPRAMAYRVSTLQSGLRSLAYQLGTRAPDVATMRRQVDDLDEGLSRALAQRLSLVTERVEGHRHRLHALDPTAILQRGYAIVQREADGQVVSRRAQVSAGQALEVTVRDGSFPAKAGGPARKPRPKVRPVTAGARLL